MSGQKRSNPSFNLKHRLTGAAILIGFAVIVLPMLFGSPSDTDGQPLSEAADPDTRVFRSNITPIAGATPNALGSGDRTEPREETPAPEMQAGEKESETRTADAADSGDGTDEAQQAEQPEPVPEAASESAETRTASAEADQGVQRGWIVQVGTFKNSENVDKLVAQLKNSGFGTSTSEVETSGGGATRVWVGPYETRVEAARIKTRVKQKVGSEGLIVAYP